MGNSMFIGIQWRTFAVDQDVLEYTFYTGYAYITVYSGSCSLYYTYMFSLPAYLNLHFLRLHLLLPLLSVCIKSSAVPGAHCKRCLMLFLASFLFASFDYILSFSFLLSLSQFHPAICPMRSSCSVLYIYIYIPALTCSAFSSINVAITESGGTGWLSHRISTCFALSRLLSRRHLYGTSTL